MITALIMWLLQPERVDFRLDDDDGIPMKISTITIAAVMVIMGLLTDIGLIKLIWKLCA